MPNPKSDNGRPNESDELVIKLQFPKKPVEQAVSAARKFLKDIDAILNYITFNE